MKGQAEGSRHFLDDPEAFIARRLASSAINGTATAARHSIEAEPRPEQAQPEESAEDGEPPGRFDFDLAEFPLLRFERTSLRARSRDPLVYEDEIRGRDGEPVRRSWQVFPGPYGWGGASAQATLFDLLQLYVAQGCRGERIEFGSLRRLLRMRGIENPGARNFAQIRRDIDVLRGYDIQTRNAFWDRRRRQYVDMHWRLFDNVFFFKERPDALRYFLDHIEPHRAR